MRPLLYILGVVIVVLVVGFFINLTHHSTTPTTPASGVSTTEQSISDGTITISYPSNFALAVNQSQILVHANIPPCDGNFNYCLYYDGSAYTGTNFQSSGLRIEKRDDLNSPSQCLTTQPIGYTTLSAKTASSSMYAVSVFGPIGNAAAGSFADGAVYRLFYGTSCYEFETRIAQSQYGNYPPGAIKQFTAKQEATLSNALQMIMEEVTLPDGEHNLFPAATLSAQA